MSEDPESRFVDAHRALVCRLARELKQRYRLKLELEELVAAGMQGLVEAKRAYEAERGIAFTSFAYYRIRGAILDNARQLGAMRRLYRRRLQFEEAANEVLSEAAEGPRGAGAEASALGARVTEAFDAMAVAWELSQAEETRAAAAASPRLNPERGASEAQLRRRLQEHLGALGPEERAVIDAFYFAGECMNEIAARFGVSKSWVSRVHTRALRKLRPLVGTDTG
jgi:RNA polymerase sigma factor FliA